MIKLIVQILDDVLRLNRGEFFFCHVTAVAQPLLQRIQRPNEAVLAGIDAVSWHPMQLASCKRFPSALSPVNAAAQATLGISRMNSDTHRMPFMVCPPRCGADRAMSLLLLHDRRRHQVQNQGHRTSGIDVYRPYLCQRHHRHCSLDKFSCVCASKSSLPR